MVPTEYLTASGLRISAKQKETITT